MKKTILILLIMLVTCSSASCSSISAESTELLEVMESVDIDLNADDITEIIEEESEEKVEENIIVIAPLEEWDCARLDYFLEYYEEPTSYETYDDYFRIFCYMLLNHIDTYEFTIENPDYGADRVLEILEEEVVVAYSDVTLFLNTYTDFWSRFTGACEQAVTESGEVLYFTYTFTLTQKYGMESEEIEEKVSVAEAECMKIVNTLFEEGALTSEMTEKERAYVLYQWIGENVSYDYSALESDAVRSDNCYDAVVNKSAVCQGITGAYVYLCRLAGVEMYVQLGYTSEGAHSWCKIDDEGTWMYIDPTWALSEEDDGQTYTDKWFWVTREFMETYPSHSREFTDYVE